MFWIRERTFPSLDMSFVWATPPSSRNSSRLSLHSSSPRVWTRSSSGGSVLSIVVVSIKTGSSGDGSVYGVRVKVNVESPVNIPLSWPWNSAL